MKFKSKRVLAVFLVVAMTVSLFGGGLAAGETNYNNDEIEEDMITRLGGVNRYDTSDIIAQYAFDPEDYPEGADTVIITEGLAFADGLAGSVLAAYLDAPILMTDTEELRGETESAIEFLDPIEAIILGGGAAVSGDVEDALEDHDLEVDRIAGVTRHDTAQLIARYIADEEVAAAGGEIEEADVFDSVFIVNGAAPPDSLIISPEAARSGVPILQVRAHNIPEVTEDALADLGIDNAHIIGGDAVVEDAVEDELEDLLAGDVNRTWGAGRFETSAAVAEEFFPAPEKLVIANGVDGLADAMSGGYFGAMKNAPVLYVNSIPDSIASYITDAIDTLQHAYILGGDTVVSEEVENDLRTLMEEVVVDLEVVSVAAESVRVEMGTALEDIDFPEEVKATLDDDSTEMLDVDWAEDSEPEYDEDAPGEYVFEGELVDLPENITNPDEIKAEFTVEVVEDLAVISVAEEYLLVNLGTEMEDIDFPEKVEATLEDDSTEMLSVDWADESDPAYDKDETGEYVFEGDLVDLPGYVTNPDEIKAQVTVEVGDFLEVVSVAPESERVEIGTALEDIDFPEEVEATLHDDSTEMLSVDWAEESEPEYDSEEPGEYVFEGELVDLPDNITNPEDIKAEFTVEVAEDLAVVSVAPEYIVVDVGTAYEEIDFPAEVEATLDDDSTTMLAVDWDEESDPAYDEDAPGEYVFEGELVDLPGYISNPDEIKAEATVEVMEIYIESGVAGFVWAEGALAATALVPVEGVTVEAGGVSTETDENGYFELELDSGEYVVEFTKAGWSDVTKEVKFGENQVAGITITDYDQLDEANITVAANVLDESDSSALEAYSVLIEKDGEEIYSGNEAVDVEIEEGAFELDDTHADFEFGATYEITVSKALCADNTVNVYEEEWREVTLAESETTNQLSAFWLRPLEALTIWGTVTDSNGDPVDEEDITLHYLDEDEEMVELADEEIDEGNYEFEELTMPTGSFFLQVDDGNDAVTTVEIQLEEGEDKEVNIELLEGEDVNYTIHSGFDEEFKEEETYKAQLKQDGVAVGEQQEVDAEIDQQEIIFTFPRVAVGEENYTVEVSGDYVVNEEYEISVPDPSTQVVDLAGTVSGTVSDDTDSIEGATVTLGDMEDVTDVNGEYEFVGVPAGEDYTVEASHEEYVTATSDEFDVEVNDDTEEIDIELLGDHVEVGGNVREIDTANPLHEATVTYYAVDVEGWEAGEQVATVITDDGAYNVELDAGSYDVVIRHADYETFVASENFAEGDRLTINYNEMIPGADNTLTLEFDREVVFEYRLADGYACPDATEEGEGVWSGTVPEQTDELVIEDLPDGDYTLEVGEIVDVFNVPYVDVEMDITLDGDKTVQITLEEQDDTYEVTFDIRDDDAIYLEDAFVVMKGEVQLTDGNGAATFEVADGEYTAAVYHDGFLVEYVDIEVEGDDVAVPRIELETYPE